MQHNGGITQTHKPNDTSPVFDQGSNTEAAALSNDQRGSDFLRIYNGTVDIGAVELQNNIIAGDAPLSIGEVMTRRDMAREILKKINVAGFLPPPRTPVNPGYSFTDIKIGGINADWIELLHVDGYTEGCETSKFCPDAIVTREAMAKIYQKIWHRSDPLYAPLPAVPEDITRFGDVHPITGFNADWIFDLPNDIALGCEANKFCPKEPVTRKWFDFLINEL